MNDNPQPKIGGPIVTTKSVNPFVHKNDTYHFTVLNPEDLKSQNPNPTEQQIIAAYTFDEFLIIAGPIETGTIADNIVAYFLNQIGIDSY